MMKNERQIRILRSGLISAAVLLFLLIIFGGMLTAAGDVQSCPGWPLCGISTINGFSDSAVLHLLHRGLSALVGLLVSGLLVYSLVHKNIHRSIRIWLSISVALLYSQVIFGAIVRIPETGNWLTSVHYALALVTLGTLLVPTVLTFVDDRKISFRSRYSRSSLFTLIALAGLFVTGASVAAVDSGQLCQTWLLCNGLNFTSIFDVVNLVHRIFVLATSVLLIHLWYLSWRDHKHQVAVLASATSTAVLFASQALMGITKIQLGNPVYLQILHEATAVAIWGSMVVHVILVGLSAGEKSADEIPALQKRKPVSLMKDLLALTKPIVVALLLVTTCAGMVIGGEAFPSWQLTFWVLLGGFMAAGGSGAINQYIDRNDDNRMQRTQKRPIPSGRLTPGEGLAFGIGISLASVYLLIAFVNLLAGLLTLAGIIYYVLLYSIFLKKTTVQNIVIGGGAGAIPPLVGWAAVTGSLNVPALMLFAIVFMWTPPHFWALAIVRQKDYARAGVPMLPVIRGEKETRKQIFIYTLELVGLTLLLPVFGLGSAVYFFAAGILGLWLISAAWKVMKVEGNKVAWKMYRYSSMYLAFLFIALMVDALV